MQLFPTFLNSALQCALFLRASCAEYFMSAFACGTLRAHCSLLNLYSEQTMPAFVKYSVHKYNVPGNDKHRSMPMNMWKQLGYVL